MEAQVRGTGTAHHFAAALLSLWAQVYLEQIV
jgi:hypothetical protein